MTLHHIPAKDSHPDLADGNFRGGNQRKTPAVPACLIGYFFFRVEKWGNHFCIRLSALSSSQPHRNRMYNHLLSILEQLHANRTRDRTHKYPPRSSNCTFPSHCPHYRAIPQCRTRPRDHDADLARCRSPQRYRSSGCALHRRRAPR